MLAAQGKLESSRSLSSGAHLRDPSARNDVDGVSIRISDIQFAQGGFLRCCADSTKG